MDTSGKDAIWYTRVETSRILERCVKTVDRLRKAGVLVDLPGGGMVRISRASIEEYMRRPVEVLVEPAGFISIEHSHYDNLLRKIQHLQAEVKAAKAEHACSQAENERLKQQYREILADLANPLTLVRDICGRKLVLVKRDNNNRGGKC